MTTRTLLVGAAVVAAVGVSAARAPLVSGQAAGRVTPSPASSSSKYRVLFNRYQSPAMTPFVADGDGRNERALLPAGAFAYSPRFSADGQWIVYTAERDGLADIYRVHPDGTGRGAPDRPPGV